MAEEISRERADYLAEAFRSAFVEHCRIRAETIRRGYLESSMEVGPEHQQQDGVVHAGAISTMADHSAGYATFTVIPEDYQLLTVEYKINFFRPAQGEALVCRSRVLKEGMRILIAGSEVYDQLEGEEMIAAKAMVTLTAVHQDKMLEKAHTPR
ncbi:MAG: PaaI family thioesterase [Desulfohalobiaceae bacterium]|nr:PaaI family thioesterase [Desulfohalobiaceae bacterium]